MGPVVFTLYVITSAFKRAFLFFSFNGIKLYMFNNPKQSCYIKTTHLLGFQFQMRFPATCVSVEHKQNRDTKKLHSYTK